MGASDVASAARAIGRRRQTFVTPTRARCRPETHMANPSFGTPPRALPVADQAAFDVGLRQHMLRVYNYMAGGLALSGIVAVGLFTSPALAALFFEVQAGRVVGLNLLGWVAIFAPLGLLMLTSFRAAQMSVGAVQAVYWAVTALMGVSLSLLLFRYTGASVARTFFVTAAAFGALSLYGYTTKRDLGAFGKFLFMGVIGIILASLVNMIWPSGTMTFVISVAGVLIFSGLIAYDTQRIKAQYAEAWGTETAEKVAIFGALSLYINFVNLFQFLMMFMGQRR
jgi:FtsH-binding integral membrane protein